MQSDLAASMLLHGIHDTGIERPGVNVQTYRPLSEFGAAIQQFWSL